jgi:hypothetical protein
MGLYARQLNSLSWSNLVIEDSGNEQRNSFACFVSNVGKLEGDKAKVVCGSNQCSRRFAVSQARSGRLFTPDVASRDSGSVPVPVSLSVERSPSLVLSQ